MYRVQLVKFFCAALLFSMVNLKAAPAGPSPTITFPLSTAQKWILSNGLTIIVQEDRSAPVASVQAWCATGSVYEDQHLGAGLSHILEHMLFKGTKTRSTNQIAQKIQDVGGYINAYTSFDRTVFWIDVPKDGVPTALDILADAMMNSTLPPEEYQKEQEVIRREFAMGMDDPDRMAGLLLFATAYQRHPYRFPVIGELEIYNQLTQEQVMQYYKTRYVPNNLTFVVVGDVDAEKVRQQLTELFKPYPEKSLQPVFIPAEPPQLGRREVHQEFATELTHLSLTWHIPEVTSPDVPALDLLSTILGDGRSSRLYRRVREEAGLAFSISAFSYTPGDPGLFGIDATLDPKKRYAAEQLVLRIIDEVKQAGVTAEELTKAKKISLSHHLGALTTMRGQASDIGSNWVLTRNLNFSRGYLDAVQKVTLDDTKAVGGSISSDAGNNTFNVSLGVTRPDVKLGVELLSDVLLNATMPEKAIEREKEIQIAAIQQEEEQLTAVARNIMRQALFPQHQYALRANGSVDSVQRLTQKDLLAFRDRYIGAKNGVIFVFGDVKAADVKALFEKALDSMKPGMLALTDIHPATPLGGTEAVESRKDKAQGVIMVGFRGASVSSPDRTVLDLIGEASSALGSRFFVRIRAQMGLAHYVGANQMQGLVPGLFAFYLGTDPQKIEPVKTALLDEIHKLANDGLTKEELARAKKKLIGQQEMANQSNDAFGYQCSLDEIYGLGFDFYKRLEHDVDAVSLDDIKRVAAKYFRDQPYVLATVRPPEGSPAAKQK